MSSALAMALMAAMALPGNDPQKESGETPEEKPLLTETWEGIWRTPDWCEGVYVNETGVYCSSRNLLLHPWKVFDEGDGKVRVFLNGNIEYLGIYRRTGDRMIIGIRPAYRGRPVTFEKGDYQDLLTLRCVKPRK